MDNETPGSGATNREKLHDIISDLLTKKRVDRAKFFEALELVHEIAQDCAERCERMSQENATLQEHNNTLTWLVISQESAISGRFRQYHA